MIIIEVSTKKHTKPLREVVVDYEIDNGKCKICKDKPCLEICPVKALFIDSDDSNVNINENCFGCVLCREVCPYDAITMETKLSEPIRENIPNINSKLCRACGACVSACKTGAIHLAASGTEQVHSEIDENKCVRCGYCFRSCPTDAIKYGEILPKTVSGGRAIVVNQDKCIGCMTCTRICPSKGAINVGKTSKLPYINPSYCARCEECMDVCPSTAIKYSSRKKAYEQYSKVESLEIVSNIVDKDIDRLKNDMSKIDSILSEIAINLVSDSNEEFEVNVTDTIIKEIDLATAHDISVEDIKDLADLFPPIRKIKVLEDSCIGCGACIEICPVNCIWLEPPSPVHIIKEECVFCGQCVPVCKVSAIELQEEYFETKTVDLDKDEVQGEYFETVKVLDKDEVQGEYFETADGSNKDEILFIRKNINGLRHGEFKIHRDLCQSCGVCVNKCPVDALTLENDEIFVNQELCISCRECESLCPVNAIKISLK